MTRDLDRKSRLTLPASIRTEIEFFLRIWCAQRPAVSPVGADSRFTVTLPTNEAPAVKAAARVVLAEQARGAPVEAEWAAWMPAVGKGGTNPARFEAAFWRIKAEHWDAAGGRQRFGNNPPPTDEDAAWRAGLLPAQSIAKRKKRDGQTPTVNSPRAELPCLR